MRQQQRELVPDVTGHDVRAAHARREHRRELPEQQVALSVAVRVVEVLEAVEVGVEPAADGGFGEERPPVDVGVAGLEALEGHQVGGVDGHQRARYRSRPHHRAQPLGDSSVAEVPCRLAGQEPLVTHVTDRGRPVASDLELDADFESSLGGAQACEQVIARRLPLLLSAVSMTLPAASCAGVV